MRAYYKVMVSKQPVGSAVMHKEPPLEGEVVTKVTDMTTGGDYKLIVLDCDDEQHQGNLTVPGVAEVSDSEAADLAPKFQPERTMTEFDPASGKESKFSVPAVDLRAITGAGTGRIATKKSGRKGAAGLSGIIESRESAAESKPTKKKS